ncbi:Protein of unknown function [Cotesia congregata]|uniref:Uncharacterized protein n=1 Tax=Cotesia congregata TaxID=51543 RepID=A0A8J2MM90_COTCN|nr:Protein of unknown function [Cotesia congregata]
MAASSRKPAPVHTREILSNYHGGITFEDLPEYCSGCGQLFHKACLLKNHKYTNERGEQIECVGHEISDNVSVASSVSSVTRKKRKRYDEEIDVSDIADKVDTLIDRVQEIGVNVEDFRYEIKNIAMQLFLDIKDDSMKTVREIVREEVQNVIGGSNDCKTEEVKSFKKLASYADRAKGSKTETVVIEPKEKQDSELTPVENIQYSSIQNNRICNGLYVVYLE